MRELTIREKVYLRRAGFSSDQIIDWDWSCENAFQQNQDFEQASGEDTMGNQIILPPKNGLVGAEFLGADHFSGSEETLSA